MESIKLIETRQEQNRQIINQAQALRTYELQYLTWRPGETAWNILECLEHLNLYSAYYLPVIEKQLKHTSAQPEPDFKSGLLGAYFAKSMLPGKRLNKMKTFKDKNPLFAHLDKTVIDKFIAEHETLHVLLTQSRNVSLNKVKVPISISRFIKLNLGDTFQFMLNHVIRHIRQIELIQQKMNVI